MKIPVDKQIAFLNWQLKENDDLFRAYLNKSMKAHFADRTAFFGKIWGVDEKRGNLIIRFDRGKAPRLNMPLSGFLFSGIPSVEDLGTWDFNYQTFRNKYAVAITDIFPIFFMNSQSERFNLVGCRDVENDFLNLFRDNLKKGKRPSIVLAERDPPVQYLINLKTFIQNHQDDKVLNLSIDNKLENWQPEGFPDQNEKKAEVLSKLDGEREMIIQGPPGTGKSYLIAEIAQHYIENGQSVCITALTNKALMEVAEKPGIKKEALKGKVYKTNLTLNEASTNQDLRQARSLGIGNGELLLATYYKLSDWYKEDSDDTLKKPLPTYEIIIIEEASQCYLATISAFKKLGRKVLIVGDPMQLPPIVLNEKEASSIHPRIMEFAHGLATYAANSNVRSYLLNKSYRLSPKAVSLTGVFYKNQLESAQGENQKINIGASLQALIPSHGETKIKYLPIITEGDRPRNAIEFVVKLLVELKQNNPGLEVAILAPFKKTVVALQEKVGRYFPDQSEITIETIDRIQGLTVDFTIYLLALNNPSFAMNLNRFNVATSRAKRGTVIITDKEYVRFMGINPLVTKYLSSLEVVE